MKIEGIETAYYRLPLEAMGDAGHGAIDSEEIITVKLRAGGLEGHGYAYTIGRGGRAVHALIEHDLIPLLVGRDATDIEALWDLMWQRLLYVGRGGLASFAIAAMDIALWDLRGLRERKPLYALLGAQARDIPAYGSGVDLPKPLNELLKQTEGFLARGLPGVKVKIGRRDAREDESRVAAVRKLIGDDVDLMLDANMAWTADEALERGRRLEQFDLYWYEEPTIPEDVAGHARLAQSARSSDRGRREPALRARIPALRGRARGRGAADRSGDERRDHGVTSRARASEPGGPQGEQPLHRRAERAPALRRDQPGLPREACLRARPLPRDAAAGGEGTCAADRSPWYGNALFGKGS